MSQENKEITMTYEQELKALKEKWAVRKKEEKKVAKENARAGKKVEAKEKAMQALEILKNIDPMFNVELAPVKKRLEMFINDERYTRNKGGDQ